MRDLKILELVVDTHRLEILLHDLAFITPGTSIRLHVEGNPRSPHFSKILVFARHAILLAHIPTRTVINLPDLYKVDAFELDKPYDAFSAFTLYVVKTKSPELKQVNDGLFYA